MGGDTFLGGEDIDRALLDLVKSKLRHPKHLAQTVPPSEAVLQCRRQCRVAKEELSTSQKATVQLDACGSFRATSVALSRSELDEAIEHILNKARAVVKAALDGCNVDAASIDEAVLVGGSSRVPAVRRMLREMFKVELCTSLDAEACVAQGAAVRGAVLGGVDSGVLSDVMMLDCIPRSIGIEVEGGR